eukprot:CAMPEP_0170599876 /NCGR_PEP_ID=MMETSP0224-20130122/17037_1 /TAXON_ID=285029 /ORGANISM="Togula jolla, Strain CCCM 725" /LENGTH=101 /DNA_ID=CAMNT_0010924569 /DNA_START=124 /DNA_END=429 /DNA_ORIENTATION=-
MSWLYYSFVVLSCLHVIVFAWIIADSMESSAVASQSYATPSLLHEFYGWCEMQQDARSLMCFAFGWLTCCVATCYREGDEHGDEVIPDDFIRPVQLLVRLA